MILKYILVPALTFNWVCRLRNLFAYIALIELLMRMVKNVITCMAAGILVALLVSCPVQAFTAKNLDITVQDNSDAVISFDYDLTWYENIAVFSRIADPGAELAKTLKSQFRKNVVVISVSGNHAQFLVENFATRSANNNAVMLSTPSLSFKNAGKVLNNYWFGRFVSPDFSPEVTRVTFPDGYFEEFYNQDLIPAIRHSIPAPLP